MEALKEKIPTLSKKTDKQFIQERLGRICQAFLWSCRQCDRIFGKVHTQKWLSLTTE